MRKLDPKRSGKISLTAFIDFNRESIIWNDSEEFWRIWKTDIRLDSKIRIGNINFGNGFDFFVI